MAEVELGGCASLIASLIRRLGRDAVAELLQDVKRTIILIMPSSSTRQH